MPWEDKLNKFLNDFEHKDDVIGILVCGSFITGHPSSHSDLDVHIILNEAAPYRERGNRIVDDLLIEYFANPPRQIREYFQEDYQALRPMSQTQFATGRIMLDQTGEVQKLKTEAQAMLDRHYADLDTSITELAKYGLWDMLDDLQDALENGRADFDFLYYCNLDKLIAAYMKFIKHPYNKKTILGNITSASIRKKYLLAEIPDPNISKLIQNCICLPDKAKRLQNYELLTNKIFDLTGGFNISTFKFQSPTSC